MLALHRKGLYWNRAAVAEESFADVGEVQWLLFQHEEGGYGLWIPLVDNGVRAYLESGDDAFTLRWSTDVLPAEAALLYQGQGADLHELCAAAMEAIQAKLGTFQLRRSRAKPEFAQGLGWCTWDAFYHEVTGEKIREGLQSFRDGDIQLGYVILDDGWLDRDGDLLLSFGTHSTQFPGGLAPVVRMAKEEFGVRQFGVWHALPGYWAGLHPDGELANRYRTVPTTGCIRPWDKQFLKLNLVHPEEASRFFDDFHGHLADQGVDFVKVDGQSSLEVFTEGQLPRVPTMAAFQAGLQASVAKHFGGASIHCMANGSDVAYHFDTATVFRNSDDFFPNKPASHGRHLWDNAINALWTSQFALPDWDMFWSGHEQGEFHAAARAISGGPIYCSDRPGEQNFSVLKRLAFPDGRILSGDRPALPSAESMFANPTQEPTLLKITNRAGVSSVIGVFHCGMEAMVVTEEVQLQHVHDADHEGGVVFSVKSGTVVAGDKATVSLDPLSWEILQFTPWLSGWLAPIGAIEKFVPAAGWQVVAHSDASVILQANGAGLFAFLVRGQFSVDEVALNEITDHALGAWCSVNLTQGQQIQVNRQR